MARKQNRALCKSRNFVKYFVAVKIYTALDIALVVNTVHTVHRVCLCVYV